MRVTLGSDPFVPSAARSRGARVDAVIEGGGEPLALTWAAYVAICANYAAQVALGDGPRRGCRPAFLNAEPRPRPANARAERSTQLGHSMELRYWSACIQNVNIRSASMRA